MKKQNRKFFSSSGILYMLLLCFTWLIGGNSVWWIPIQTELCGHSYCSSYGILIEMHLYWNKKKRWNIDAEHLVVISLCSPSEHKSNWVRVSSKNSFAIQRLWNVILAKNKIEGKREPVQKDMKQAHMSVHIS